MAEFFWRGRFIGRIQERWHGGGIPWPLAMGRWSVQNPGGWRSTRYRFAEPDNSTP